MHRPDRAAVLVALLVASPVLLACGANDQPTSGGATAAPAVSAATAQTAASLRGGLTVFAASSLTDAFNEIASQFRKAFPNVRVTCNFGASSTLRNQLEQGAKADVFASADQIQMDSARRAGVIQGDDRLFAKNKLVLIYPTGNPARIGSIQDLARPGVKLVLTDRGVPIGNYARTALEKMSADPQFGTDFAQKVLGNLRSEEANVRAVVTKVQLGEADAAIVYASDVTPAIASDVQSILIPDQFNTIATYPIAVLKDAPNRAAAEAFIDFVRSARGQEILKKNNFIVDRETGVAGAPAPPAVPLTARKA